MDLMILGNANERGTGLEALTAKLLQARGYENITTRKISSGGHEIDVEADYVVKTPGKTVVVKTVCECKALQAPVDTPSWLKFLGKLYDESLRTKNTVHGCLVALSGINGNVKGGYDELRKHSDLIEVLHGMELYQKIRDLYELSSVEEIHDFVRKNTDREYVSLHAAYWAGRLYSIVRFDAGFFTVLVTKDSSVSLCKDEDIIGLVKEAIASGEYLDLEEEYESRLRKEWVEKFVVKKLMDGSGSLKKKDLFDTLIGFELNDSGAFSISDVEGAIESLLKNKYVVVADDDTVFLNVGNVELRVRLIKKMMSGATEPSFFYGEFYDGLIDEDLLSFIATVQGGLEVPQEYVQDCLRILRWSPLALAWALTSDPMLVEKYKQEGFKNNDEFKKNDVRYFRMQLLETFEKNFKSRSWYDYFYHKRKIVEVEGRYSIKIKSKEKTEVELDAFTRIGVGEVAQEHGGGVIGVWKLESAPEPWEQWSEQEDKESVN